VLNVELERVGAEKIGPKAKAQLDLNPALDFTKIAEGMGVPAVSVSGPEAFTDALQRALNTPGPHLIEAVVPPTLSGLKLKLLPHVLGSLNKLPQPLAHVLKRKLAP
jgi:acetolactate synthase-1/2/3 large subunit